MNICLCIILLIHKQIVSLHLRLHQRKFELMEYKNVKNTILLVFFFTVYTPLFAQQVYLFQGRIVTVDSLMYHYETEDAIKKIERLAEQPDKNLSQKEQSQYQLGLALLKAKIYDRNFEQGKALVVLLDILEKSTAEEFHKITAETYLLMAQVKRNGNDLKEDEKFLNLAQKAIEEHKFDELYSNYYYQKASSLRMKSDFTGVIENAGKALKYGEKYQNAEDIANACTMLGGGYAGKGDKQQAIRNFKRVIPHYQKTNNYTFVAMMYRNIAREYFKQSEFKDAHTYIDSAYLYYDKMSYFYKEFLPLMRLDLYAEEKKWDSAFAYMKDFHNLSFQNLQIREASKIKDVTEKYDNDTKATEIKEKNRQMIWIGTLLAVIAIASVLLFRKNREISRKNKVINKQLAELSKTLDQKQMLLSELQHRVKNNLQHVISILEIQKESVDFNNIDELIRENQNRIHSMALLHKKLNVSDNVNDVDVKRYVTELSELVKESYDNHKKKINLYVKCELQTMSIEKALPIGLIITELVSNSMKHAFKKRSVGIINIELTKNEETGNKELYYADNGEGFDFNAKNEKGLGQEIIKGLIDQLNGKIELKSHNGFELRMYFI